MARSKWLPYRARTSEKEARMGFYWAAGEKELGRAPAAPATDEKKAPARKIGKGSMLRFAHVSAARTTLRGGVAVFQSVGRDPLRRKSCVPAAKLMYLISTSKRYGTGFSQVCTGIPSRLLQLRTGLTRTPHWPRARCPNGAKTSGTEPFTSHALSRWLFWVRTLQAPSESPFATCRNMSGRNGIASRGNSASLHTATL